MSMSFSLDQPTEADATEAGLPYVLIEAAAPHAIVFSSPSWAAMVGLVDNDDAVGKSLDLFSGPGTDTEELRRLLVAARSSRPYEADLISYDMQKQPFRHTLSLRPVMAPSSVLSLLRAESRNVAPLSKGANGRRARGREAVSATSLSLQAEVLSFNPPPTPSGAMTVITQGHAPYSVLWASPAWLSLCGFTAVELMGDSLRCIQGPGTDAVKIQALMAAVARREAVSVEKLVNYDKHKVPFVQNLSVEPISTPRGTFFRASSSAVCRLGPPLAQPSDVWWGDAFEEHLAAWEELDRQWASRRGERARAEGRVGVAT
ncbi:putative PAS domain protein [Emiliania huxleyi CCMP1516]|uniref:PAS domain-containing protein n=2 Tax=Emiliania huxleyi TaxID=2903 RepID=A0A0D3HXF4_EMIH1|nr:putative PAS domain protein [Emiliania huxleyi CCMP1516]EOD03689.1 putative PAS domain protein [Emiliania huxleyi CCMP1516]|eukprot:XP_005756118.1 putative PAS domain protein [Emiliania huxleyi CCMP1516]